MKIYATSPRLLFLLLPSVLTTKCTLASGFCARLDAYLPASPSSGLHSRRLSLIGHQWEGKADQWA